MSLVELEFHLSHLRAKSSSDGHDSGISLFQHSVDVVRQMHEFIVLYSPKWPLASADICLPRVLAYSALTHDFGKAHAGFQRMLKGEGRFRNRHEILSLAFLDLLDIPEEERCWIEAAVGLHHKNLCTLVGAKGLFYVGATFGEPGTYVSELATGISVHDQKLLRKFLTQAGAIFEMAGWTGFEPYPVHDRSLDIVPAIKNALQRVSALARTFEAEIDSFGKICSNVPWDRRRAGVQIRGFMLSADHLASFGARSLSSSLTSAVALRSGIGARVQTLNSHQRSASRTEGSAIMIAPTGTGKTEAALLWAARQDEVGRRGRTYLLLPYQASMNAMQQRLIATFKPELNNQPEFWNEHVALIHGRSMRALYEKLMEREDYSPAQANLDAHLQNDLGRLNVAPMRVCSPYQIIKLLFAPKGVEGLLIALSEAKLIFDEVHAYEPTITALLLTATRMLTEHFGTSALFMTATMPSHLRSCVQELFGDLPVIVPGNDVLDCPVRHRLKLMETDVLSPESLHAIREASRDKSVLIVVNQINRAIAVFRELQPHVTDIHVLHSRFTASDRTRKEREIEPRPGRVLVATQVVEVSLDLDYDCCFSELAPLEALLQRFGRCNRRGRQSEPAPVSVFTKFPGNLRAAFYPYDQDHLTRTLDVLRSVFDDSGLLEEHAVTKLLDHSYPEALKNALLNELRTRNRELQDNFVTPFVPFGAQESEALFRLEEQWEALFDGQELLPEALLERAAMESSWLARARYLVPVSRHKFRELWARKLISWNPDLMSHIVSSPYSEFGLQV